MKYLLLIICTVTILMSVPALADGPVPIAEILDFIHMECDKNGGKMAYLLNRIDAGNTIADSVVVSCAELTEFLMELETVDGWEAEFVPDRDIIASLTLGANVRMDVGYITESTNIVDP